MLERGAKPDSAALTRIFTKKEIHQYLPQLAHLFPMSQEEKQRQLLEETKPLLRLDIEQGFRADNPIAAMRYFVQATPTEGKGIF